MSVHPAQGEAGVYKWGVEGGERHRVKGGQGMGLPLEQGDETQHQRAGGLRKHPYTRQEATSSLSRPQPASYSPGFGVGAR